MMDIVDKIIDLGAELQKFIDAHVDEDGPDDDQIFAVIQIARRLKAKKEGRSLSIASKPTPWSMK